MLKNQSRIKSIRGRSNSLAIGRRTNLNVLSGKSVRKRKDGVDFFEDYWTSSSDDESNLSVQISNKNCTNNSKLTVNSNSDDVTALVKNIEDKEAEPIFFKHSKNASTIKIFAAKKDSVNNAIASTSVQHKNTENNCEKSNFSLSVHNKPIRRSLRSSNRNNSMRSSHQQNSTSGQYEASFNALSSTDTNESSSDNDEDNDGKVSYSSLRKIIPSKDSRQVSKSKLKRHSLRKKTQNVVLGKENNSSKTTSRDDKVSYIVFSGRPVDGHFDFQYVSGPETDTNDEGKGDLPLSTKKSFNLKAQSSSEIKNTSNKTTLSSKSTHLREMRSNKPKCIPTTKDVEMTDCMLATEDSIKKKRTGDKKLQSRNKVSRNSTYISNGQEQLQLQDSLHKNKKNSSNNVTQNEHLIHEKQKLFFKSPALSRNDKSVYELNSMKISSKLKICNAKTSSNNSDDVIQEAQSTSFLVHKPENRQISHSGSAKKKAVGNNLIGKVKKHKTKAIFIPEVSNPPCSVRQSSRLRVKPLAYWRNERMQLKFTKSGEIDFVGIDSGTQNHLTFEREKENRKNPKKITNEKTNFINKHSRKNFEQKHVVGPIHGACELNKFEPIEIIDPETNEIKHADVIKPFDELVWKGPKDVSSEKNNSFSISKTFVSDTSSVGFLVLMGYQEKTYHHLQDDDVIFVIVKGKVRVQIFKSTCLLGEKDSFHVPKGNSYSITNMDSTEATLMFFTSRYSLQEYD